MKSRNLVISVPEKDRLVDACVLTNADFGRGWSSWAEENKINSIFLITMFESIFKIFMFRARH